jgi:hypothetical protein
MQSLQSLMLDLALSATAGHNLPDERCLRTYAIQSGLTYPLSSTQICRYKIFSNTDDVAAIVNSSDHFAPSQYGGRLGNASPNPGHSVQHGVGTSRQLYPCFNETTAGSAQEFDNFAALQWYMGSHSRIPVPTKTWQRRASSCSKKSLTCLSTTSPTRRSTPCAPVLQIS